MTARRHSGPSPLSSGLPPRPSIFLRRLAATVVCALLPLAPIPALEAQSGGVFVDGGASHSLSPSGSEVDASTYLLGGLRAQYRVASGSGVFASAYGGVSLEESAGDWGSLTVGGDLWASLADGVQAGIGGLARGFVVGAPFEYRAVTGDLRPRLRFRLGEAWLTLEGRGGVGRSEVEIRDSPALPPGLAPTSEVVADLWYYGGGPELRVPAGPLRLSVGGAYYDSDPGEYQQGYLRVDGGTGEIGVSAELNVWDTPTSGTEVTGSLTLRVPVGSSVSVRSTGGRSHPDPLLQTPPGVQGSLMASYRTVSFEPAETPPLYTVEPAADGARVVVRLPAAEAEEVSVMGDFSGWEPVEMEERDGVWTVRLQVPPGVYHFGFLVDGEWFVPEEAPGRVEDDWGRVNATLVVSGE